MNATENTDITLLTTWDGCRVFATQGREGIGIDAGGHCIVKPVRAWYALAAAAPPAPEAGEPPNDEAEFTGTNTDRRTDFGALLKEVQRDAEPVAWRAVSKEFPNAQDNTWMYGSWAEGLNPRTFQPLYAAPLAQRDAERDALVQLAFPIVQEYARRNPRWTSNLGNTQDPCGAHAWLEKASALSAAKEGQGE